MSNQREVAQHVTAVQLGLKDPHTGVAKTSISRVIKNIWKTAGRPGSLKAYVKSKEMEREIGKLRDAWLHNKTANVANPPEGIGRTRKKKGGK